MNVRVRRRAAAYGAVSVAALASLCGCGAGGHRLGGSTPLPDVRSPASADGPALGLTEDDAGLLGSQRTSSPRGESRFEAARQALTALHPAYLRLLVDWAAVQPDPHRPAALEAQVSGCARGRGPCVPYAGIRDELAAIASQQRAADVLGAGRSFQVVIDIFGAPAWAARAPSGCERAGSTPFSRPLASAAIAAYRGLIRSLLALGAREGVALRWWSPWNEPNDAVFISPQRAACTAGSTPLAPAVYAQLARAMAAELEAAGGERHLLLGELNAYQSNSPDSTSISQFVAALPADVICLSETWSIHAYASRGSAAAPIDPVKALEGALDLRGGCARRAGIWVTEAGAGASHPGQPRPAGGGEEAAGCMALAEQLLAWHSDPRVGAVFQYTFREDPAFPVGLLSADLSHTYPTYRLWLAWSRLHAAARPPPAGAVGCA